MEIGPRLEPGANVHGGDQTTAASASGRDILATPSPAVSFARVLAGLAREADVGEIRVRGALRATSAGSDLGPGELIALQAGVYRYSEVVDLSARLIDHVTSGLKTVLQGQ
jgi:hypothetical protein